MDKFSLYLNKDAGEKQVVHCPYNDLNKLISKQEVQKLLSLGGINLEITDLSLYQRAFVHKSYCHKKNQEQIDRYKESDVVISDKPDGFMDLLDKSNERLEFLGDSVLGCVVATYLFKRYYNQDEGFMTKLKTKLVKTQALAEFARYLKLGQHMIISKHVEDKSDGRNNDRILEDTFESFIGAMYLDFNKNTEINDLKVRVRTKLGYQICENFLLNIMEDEVDFERLILHDDNYKDVLLRYYQHNFQITPEYRELSVDGPAHKRVFIMAVLDKDGKVVATGTGRTKKKAEQLASKKALIGFGEISDDEDE